MEDLIRTIGQTIIDTYTKAAEDAARIVPKELADKEVQISNLKSRILALEAECRDRAAREEAMRAEIDGWKKSNAAKQTAVEELTKAKKQYERTIQSYAEENAARSQKADSYSVVIRQQEEIIRQRNASIKNLEEQLRLTQAKVHTLTTEPLVANLQKKLTAAQNQVRSYRETIEGQKAQIISLEGRLQQPVQPQMVPTIQVGRVTWNAEEIQKAVDNAVRLAQENERLKRIPKNADTIFVNNHPCDTQGIIKLINTIAQLRSEIQGLRSTAPIIKVAGQYMTANQVEAMKKALDDLREKTAANAVIAKRATSTLNATRRHIVVWRNRARTAEEQLKQYKDVEDFERRKGTMLDSQALVQQHKDNAEYYRNLLLKERQQASSVSAELTAVKQELATTQISLRAMTDERNQWRGKAAELMNNAYHGGSVDSDGTLTATTPINCVRAVIQQPDKVNVVIGGDEFPAVDIREAFAALKDFNNGLVCIDGIIYYHKDIKLMATDLMSKQESIRVVTDANSSLTDEVRRLRPFEEEVKQLRKENTSLRLAKKIHDGREKARGQAAQPVSKTSEMKAGVEYMTTPCGMLPVDSDGMRYLVDRLATAYAVNEELNATLKNFTETVQGLINKT